ncbi:MAG: hypothetical protein M0Z76_09895 [Gammaproteobacteria bacterium]|nr:hypothetical protein [Gammaproteobacteria bacterium]
MSAFNRRLAVPRIAGMPLVAAIGWLAAGTTTLLGIITALPAFFPVSALCVGLALVCQRLGDDLRFWPVMIAALAERRCAAREERA